MRGVIEIMTEALLLAAAFSISAGRLPSIVVEPGMSSFVARAADDLAGDIEKIFGKRPDIVSASRPDNAIVLAKGGSGWENYAVESMLGNLALHDPHHRERDEADLAGR